MKRNLVKRIIVYFMGLFIMTIGIALSVKSNLGVSPVSSIPYTMTCVWGIEMGKATILFHCVLVVLQIILLRREFKVKNLLQVFVGIIFGYFTTFCNWGVSFLPTPENIGIRIAMILLSTVFVAIGIFFYMPADIMPLAGEGAMQAVSKITGIEFPKVKIGFDISMVIISLITCLCMIKSFGSVGVGTIIAAVLVGTILGMISKKYGSWRDQFLGVTKEAEQEAELNADNYVITIAREYGSGGREIGKRVAKLLGIDYYDLEVIRKTAEESGVTMREVEKVEQTVKSPVAQSLLYWCVGSTSELDLPIVERIYHTQKKVIRDCAGKKPCVIVGRLSNFILEDYRHISVFIGADMEQKIERVKEREHLTEEDAMDKIKKVESERENHCYYFTRKRWKDMGNYDFYAKSNLLGVEKTAEMIAEMARIKYGAPSM